MHITLATPADIPALSELLNVLFSQEAEFTPDTEAQQRGLGLIVGNPEIGSILLARNGAGEVQGMVNLLWTVSTALGARVGLLEDMVVAPAARGLGVGSRLLNAAIAEAERQGCRRLTLLTDSDNVDAQRFYRRQGFVPSPMAPWRLVFG
jgi:GNAT superfamily N-acetyltransferase